MYLREMNPAQLHQAVAQNWPLLVPAGCIEYHGPHMALGTDTLIAEEVCKRLAERMSAVIAPSFAYGATGYALSGPDMGTIDIDNLAFESYTKSVLRAFCGMGFQRIAVCVHHQGMDGPLALAFRKAAAELLFELPREAKGAGWWGAKLDLADRDYRFNRIRVLPTYLSSTRLDPSELGGGHAGRFETSLLLGVEPAYVEMEKLNTPDLPWFCTEHPAAQATQELGERAFEAMAAAWEAELRAWT